MNKRIDEIFDQVMDEDCANPLYRFAELVDAAAVAREREVNKELLEALKFAQAIIGHPDDAGSKFIAAAIAKAEVTK
jgi:hypothetical protein